MGDVQILQDYKMVEVTTTCDVVLERMPNGGLTTYTVEPHQQLPKDVEDWVIDTIGFRFNVTQEEEKDMCHTVTRTLTLEVEVDYDETETGRVIKNATLQNVVYDKDIPNYVKAWAENVAKDMVRKGVV